MIDLQSARERKLDVLRIIFCTYIRMPAEEVDKKRMCAWNFLISRGLRYAANFRELAGDEKIS